MFVYAFREKAGFMCSVKCLLVTQLITDKDFVPWYQEMLWVYYETAEA